MLFSTPRTPVQHTNTVDVEQKQSSSVNQNTEQKAPKEEKNYLEKAKTLFSTKKAKIIAAASAAAAIAVIAAVVITKHKSPKASPELEEAFGEFFDTANELFS